MLDRSCLSALLLVGLVLPMVGCSNSEVGLISVTPATQPLAVGQTVQFTATGAYGHGSHAASYQNVTNLVTWTSSVPAVATISSSGVATAVSAGTATITASMKGFNGPVSGSATLTVSQHVVSLSIIPGTQTVLSPNETGQFIAIGTSSAGIQMDVTNAVTWASSDINVATIIASGLATGLSPGTTTISAIWPNLDGSKVTGTATFMESTGPGTYLSTVTVYLVGNNGGAGTVTAPAPGTTTPLIISCGYNSLNECVETFPLGSTLTLTATPAPGDTFGGWTVNCLPNQATVPTGANTCSVQNLPGNEIVGAIFNH
jgi:hypothetical protein